MTGSLPQSLAVHPDRERVLDLLARWEEAEETGTPLSVEVLCRDHPELIPELRQCIAALLAMGSFLDLGEASLAKRAPATAEGGWQFSGFNLLEECGRGGMGVVYRAFDRRRQQVVALKTLQRLDSTAVFRFKREFRALADVVHRNLVALYELGCDAGQWYFTMEYVPGVPFGEYLRGRAASWTPAPTVAAVRDESERQIENSADLRRNADPLPLCRVRLADAFVQLCEGISALHRAHKLHRDLKPSNVVVTAEGRVVLLDFGLTAELGADGIHHSTEQHIIGTIGYMSPEQSAGAPVTRASDWYSVGVMLYESLAGRLPYTGSAAQILTQKVHVDPPPPQAFAPAIPDDLNALTMGLLARDPALRLSGEDLLRVLGPANRAKAAPPVDRRRQEAPFVGRVAELATLAEAFAVTQTGRSVVVFVHGASGMGKSALVERFLEQSVAPQNGIVLAGRCYERESVPYKALDSVIDALSSYLRRLHPLEVEALLPRDAAPLAQVFPVLHRVEAIRARSRRATEPRDLQEQRRRAFVGLRELLGRLGDRYPLVLYIDDLQWGDADSASLLCELLRPPEAPPILAIGCYRREDAATSPFLQALVEWRRQAGAELDQREIAVEALAASEATTLATRFLSEQPVTATNLARIADESRGSPYFLYELAQFLSARETAAELFSSDCLSLDEVLWRRIEKLPPAACRLLTAVAVFGKPIDRDTAWRAADLPGSDAEPLAILRVSRLLRATGDGLERIATYHDRVRETVVGHATADDLAACHARLATALAASDDSAAEDLAHHYHACGRLDEARRYYRIAGDRATQTLAFERAAAWFRAALDLTLADPIARESHLEIAALRTRLAEALANAGRGAEAAEQYLASGARAAPREALDLQRLAATQYLISGHIDEGLATLDTVLEAVGMRMPSTPQQALWSLLVRRTQLALRGLRFKARSESEISPDVIRRIDVCWSAVAGLSNIDIIRGSDFQTRSLLLALKAGDPFRVARALAVEAVLVSVGGGSAVRRGEKLLTAAAELAEQVKHPYAFGIVALARGTAAFLNARWLDALEHCDRADEIFRGECTGAAWELDTAHTYALWALLYSGRLGELSRRGPILLKEAEERGDRYATMNFATQIMTMILLAANRVNDATANLFETRWTQRGFHVQHLNSLFSEVKLRLYVGDPAPAWQRMNDEWPAIEASLLMRIQMLRIDYRYQHACCALAMAARKSSGGEAAAEQFRRIALVDARLLGREGIAWGTALGTFVQAGVVHLEGDDAASARLFARAAEELAAADLGLCAAVARRCRGQLVGGEAGAAMVEEAEAWMRREQILDPARMSAIFAPTFA